MHKIQTVLIAVENEADRNRLCGILADTYEVRQAADGQDALALLIQDARLFSAVLLDLAAPQMDSFAFLRRAAQIEDCATLPILALTDGSDHAREVQAFQLGAWDCLEKPLDGQVVRLRLKNAIARSRLSADLRLKWLSEFDALTGIYNREKFCEAVQAELAAHPEQRFAIIRFDIDRFQLVNAFFGTAEGDRLLRYIGTQLAAYAVGRPQFRYGRIEADIFAVCTPYADEAEISALIAQAKQDFKAYNRAFDIIPIFGICLVEDHATPVRTLLDRANLAAKRCKGNYIETAAYYTRDMSLRLEQEQEIINDMNTALEQGQFFLHIQPKYSLNANLHVGGEALVRWAHPRRGLIPPGEFVPLFERNGFIVKLDYFVWESVCALLRTWRERGYNPPPVSVNVSRVNLYNPQIVDIICALTARYDIPPSLLHLELTESAYIDNPQAMRTIIRALREKGFTILMDDFGSGYSSLGILKDLEFDLLKIDTQFFETSAIPGRGENIIASVVRMAKWLNIPVVAEGVERADQVEFLRGIGCEYAQGYYFARPMPVEDYEALIQNRTEVQTERIALFDADSLWTANAQLEMLFSNAPQATCVCEFENGHLETLHANQAYFDLLGHTNDPVITVDFIKDISPDYRDMVLVTAQEAVDTLGVAQCDCLRLSADEGRLTWLNVKLKYVRTIGGKHILLGTLFDITEQKEIERELQKYRSAASGSIRDSNTLLVVDDVEVNRAVLRSIFEDKFTVLEAENGVQAIEVLQAHANRVDIILLDLQMPAMDGVAFLNYKKEHGALADIPVVIITADNDPDQQINMLSLGANDYIVKPFVAETIIRRVNNVLESNRRFREMLREYNTVVEQAQVDPLTQLYNRTTAEALIREALARGKEKMHAFLMIDLDNFKAINDTYGHSYGDTVLLELAQRLKNFFRKGDMVSRLGGDEFCVLMADIASPHVVMSKCRELCQMLAQVELGAEKSHISCSIGVAIASGHASSFETLYRNADSALYEAKNLGKNRAVLFADTDELRLVRDTGDLSPVPEQDRQAGRQYEQRVRLIEALPCGVAVYRYSDTVELVFYSDMLCAISGYTRAEYAERVREDRLALVHPDEREALRRQLRQCIHTGELVKGICRLEMKSGGYKQVYLNALHLPNPEDAPLLCTVFLETDGQTAP